MLQCSQLSRLKCDRDCRDFIPSHPAANWMQSFFLHSCRLNWKHRDVNESERRQTFCSASPCRNRSGSPRHCGGRRGRRCARQTWRCCGEKNKTKQTKQGNTEAERGRSASQRLQVSKLLPRNPSVRGAPTAWTARLNVMFCEGRQRCTLIHAFSCRTLASIDWGNIEKRLSANLFGGTRGAKAGRRRARRPSASSVWSSLLPAQPLLCPAGWLQAEWARRTSRSLATCKREPSVAPRSDTKFLPRTAEKDRDVGKPCLCQGLLMELWPPPRLLSRYPQENIC